VLAASDHRSLDALASGGGYSLCVEYSDWHEKLIVHRGSAG
jgi:hypothetical protein